MASEVSLPLGAREIRRERPLTSSPILPENDVVNAAQLPGPLMHLFFLVE
jgi:hypothetical protein